MKAKPDHEPRGNKRNESGVVVGKVKKILKGLTIVCNDHHIQSLWKHPCGWCGEGVRLKDCQTHECDKLCAARGVKTKLKTLSVRSQEFPKGGARRMPVQHYGGACADFYRM